MLGFRLAAAVPGWSFAALDLERWAITSFSPHFSIAGSRTGAEREVRQGRAFFCAFIGAKNEITSPFRDRYCASRPAPAPGLSAAPLLSRS
jgi:hypothetical protein